MDCWHWVWMICRARTHLTCKYEVFVNLTRYSVSDWEELSLG